MFKNSGSKQIEVVNKIIQFLDIKFNSQESQMELSAIWTANAQQFNLTPKEMINAYQMAINQKILSKKGEPIKIFPNLSILTQSEIFNAYQEFKKNDVIHQEAIKKLKEIKNKNTEPDLEKIEQEFIKTILSEIKANKKFRHIECYLLLKDVPNRFKPTKKQYELLFKQESDFLKLQNDKKNNDENDKIRLKKIIQNQKLSFEVLVKQRVYNIIVCNWLNKTIIQNDKNR